MATPEPTQPKSAPPLSKPSAAAPVTLPVDDPTVLDQMARVGSFQRVSEWTARRGQAARALGRPPGPEGSLGKLAASELARSAALTHARIAGASGMLRDDVGTTGDGLGSVIAEVLVSTPAQSIAGGTDEIQHNIIGENILGLPREPAVDRNIAFRDVPH